MIKFKNQIELINLIKQIRVIDQNFHKIKKVKNQGNHIK